MPDTPTPQCNYGRPLVDCHRTATFDAERLRWLCSRHLQMRAMLDKEFPRARQAGYLPADDRQVSA